MEIINRRQRMASVARKLRREGDVTIGLVPTMGALHAGHLSLIREARRMCDYIIVSIFVNPLQFGPGEDFTRYPRNLTHDTSLLTDYNVDYIFAPSPEEMYPPGFSSFVEVEGVGDILEGAIRTGHFRGVATVLTLLLNTVRPDFAFFGQKDAQQVAIVKRLVRDFAIETEIVVMPVVREESGLAMSSRNAYLTDAERRQAAVLYQALHAGEKAYQKGERSARRLAETVRTYIETESNINPEYVSVVDAETFQFIDKIDNGKPTYILLAARVGNTRLIDNVLLQPARAKTQTITEV